MIVTTGALLVSPPMTKQQPPPGITAHAWAAPPAAAAQTQRTCRNLLKLAAALGTLLWEADVEPTNKSVERPVWRAVLWWRRVGPRSAAGSQGVERLLTAVPSVRQQHQDVLAYLTAACPAAIRGEHAPSLLPALGHVLPRLRFMTHLSGYWERRID